MSQDNDWDDFEPEDYEKYMGGPEDNAFDENVEDEDYDEDRIDYMLDSDDEYNQEMHEYHEYISSYRPYHEQICNELLLIIKDAGGKIGFEQAFEKVAAPADHYHREIVCMLLILEKYIDPEPAVRDMEFVLTNLGIDEAKRLNNPVF